MSAGFTPGPWSALKLTTVFSIRSSDTSIAVVQDRGRANKRAQATANARLIAAAPELYEALDALLEASERHIFGDECFSQRNAARAVLRQARGEQ